MKSSPEHLARTVGALVGTRSFQVFAAFVRLGDVRRWLMDELRISDEAYAAALVDLDNRQAELLPEKIDDIAPKTEKRLRAIFEFVLVQIRKKGERGILHAISKHAAERADGSVLSWKLRLPVPLAHEEIAKVSPTRLDSYRRCPFTHFLNRKDVLGDKRMDDRAAELAGWEFGNVVHAALENWGLSDLKDSADAAAIAAFLGSEVDRQLDERFGASVPSAVAPQGADAKRRLAAFAERQARHRAAGWRIEAIERKMEMTVGHTLVYGKCDRIDVNEKTGDRLVIDYKTWNSAESAERIGGESLQLPLYRAMIGPTDGKVDCGYWVLPPAEREAPSLVVGCVRDSASAVREAAAALARMERGLYWPPSPRNEWRFDFADWLYPTPEQSVDEHWIADQEKRKEALAHGS